MCSEGRSLLWLVPQMQSYLLGREDMLVAMLPSYAFGGTSSKIYEFRGCWGGLKYLMMVADALKLGTQHRITKKLTNKKGKFLVSSYTVVGFTSNP